MELANLADQNDQTLMKQLAANELSAWSELVKRYNNLIYSIAFQILKNPEDTEDALQNTFVSLKYYANKYDSSQPLKPWLSRIASVEAIRIYNKKKKIYKKEIAQMDTTNKLLPTNKKSVAEIVEQKEISLLIKKAIDSLPEMSRMAITLYYVGGMNQTEIAHELGLSQFSISEKIKSGIEKVKSYLKNAGAHASIIISPSLVTESLVCHSTPKELVESISSKLPTEEQLLKITTKDLTYPNQQITNHPLFWKGCILSLLGITILWFYFINPSLNKNPIKIISNTPVASNKKNEEKTGEWQPIDFEKTINFSVTREIVYRDGKENVSGEVENIIYTNTDTIWNLNKSLNNKTISIKKDIVSKDIEGICFNYEFNKPFVFKSKVNIKSKNSDFGFILFTPIENVEKVPKQIDETKSNISQAHFGTLGEIKASVNCSLEYTIYVWANNGKWHTASFLKEKNRLIKNTFVFASLTFTKTTFQIGFYSNAIAEVSHFEYFPLESNWLPQNDPEIKTVLKQIPITALPDSK